MYSHIYSFFSSFKTVRRLKKQSDNDYFILLPFRTFPQIPLHLLNEVLVVHESILVWPLQTQA